jgi:hypothetical protein
MKSLDNEKMHEDSLVDAIGYLNCLHMADARDQLLDAPLHVVGDMEIWRDKPAKGKTFWSRLKSYYKAQQ